MDQLLVTMPSWVPGFITVIILVATVYGFIREKLPPDLTSLLALLALLISGVLTPQEAFSGFSHPATVAVAAVLVLSAGLNRTGALAFIARRVLLPVGRSEFLLSLVLMSAIALLSAFVNNTAAVAVFIPVVLEVGKRTGVAASRLMMPMAFAATLGGMCTLIGTSTNLVGHSVARFQGFAGYGMWDLAQVGLPMLLAGFTYLLLIGRFMLPRNQSGLESLPGRSGPYLSELEVTDDSPWISRTVKPDTFMRDHDIELVDLVRKGQVVRTYGEESRYEASDRLRVRGALEDVLALAARSGLELHRPGSLKSEGEAPEKAQAAGPAGDDPEAEAAAAAAASAALPVEGRPDSWVTAEAENAGGPPLAEFVVLPGSPLIGRTIKAMRFADRFEAIVLALHRPGERLSERPNSTPLRPGDVLVLEAQAMALSQIARTPGFLLVGSLQRPDVRPEMVWVSLLTIAGVVLSVSAGLLPIVTAASAGCAVLMLTGCLTPREAYQAIDWRIIFVLAGALALATALETTGLTAAVANSLGDLTQVAGPMWVMAAFFLATSLVSTLISNAGTVALIGPIAVSSAVQMGINPMALLTAVTLGSSCSFATPIGYQTNLMVYGPGGYRFSDFMRVGLPLNLLLAIIAIWLIPWFWPLVSP
jgi:di/tricarboxylate transporter